MDESSVGENSMDVTGNVDENVDGQGKIDTGIDDEETAEYLMTDMKLEDETDYVRDFKPGRNWLYHIEVYPWNADDMTENFIKMIKLASFSKMSMKKKHTKETDDEEKLDDKLQRRQRKGCLHLYVDMWQTAKTLLRSLTWKTMTEKELNIEIKRRHPEDGHIETGDLKDRSAKISNIPGLISREFLDVTFSRAYVVYEENAADTGSSNKETNLQIKLQEMENFNGSLDADCLAKGSCRSLVLAYKKLIICGNKININANNQQTMVVPQVPQDFSGKGTKKDTPSKETPGHTHIPPLLKTPLKGNARGRGLPSNLPEGGMASSFMPFGRGFQRESASGGRARGMGRGNSASARPSSSSAIRSGPGMPIPMTGRQKMNEKMKRMNPSSAGPLIMSGAPSGSRGPSMGSVGDSFKQEIASLQNQLERSTKVLTAQIARLKKESNFYNGNMGSFDHGSEWNDDRFDYERPQSGYMFDSYEDLQHNLPQDDFGAVLAQEDFGFIQNDIPNYHFPKQGSARARSMKPGIDHHNSHFEGLQGASRGRVFQPRGRGSELKSQARGRAMMTHKGATSHQGVRDNFW